MTKLALTPDGAMYAGRTDVDVVTRMRESGIFTTGKTDAEYMMFVSNRAKALDGAIVRHDTADHFLFDLQAAGFLTIKEL
jgi:hypothetical protein